MSDPVPKPDAIDEANADFWKSRTLAELTEGVKPITSWEDLAIPDLTDEEWEAFQAALKDE